MTLPQVEAAVEDLQHANRELLAVVDALSEADWERPVPYGEWTVKDLIAHAIGDMSPSGPGLIHAGIVTPEFIEETSRTFDVRSRNDDMVAERRRLTREDLRQMLFPAHDAFIDAAYRLDERHLPVLDYDVPMGPEYSLKVLDWLWRGYHPRQHADDIRRALEVDYKPENLTFLPEIDEQLGVAQRRLEGFVRAVYSVADDAWNEIAPGTGGWTYHDVAAHISSNESRTHIRLRSALGEASEDELKAIDDIDGWNATSTAERKDWPVRRLIDELLAGRYETHRILSRFKAEHLDHEARIGSGITLPAREFIHRVLSHAHTSHHAGQLVPASRARRQS